MPKTNAELLKDIRDLERTIDRLETQQRDNQEEIRFKNNKLEECKVYIKWAQAQLKLKNMVIVTLAEQLHDFSRCDELENDPTAPIF